MQATNSLVSLNHLSMQKNPPFFEVHFINIMYTVKSYHKPEKLIICLPYDT